MTQRSFRIFWLSAAILACLLPLLRSDPATSSTAKKDGTPENPAAATKAPALPAPSKVHPKFSRDPYLQLATPTSIRILWRTREVLNPVVKWGSDRQSLTHSVTEEKGIAVRRTAIEGESTEGTKPLHSAPPKTTQYEATLTQLTADTKYFYAIYDGEVRLTPDDGTFYFRTLPDPGQPREAWMWVAGDGGTGGRTQAAVHQAMINYSGSKGINLDLFLHVGDMAYTSGLDSEFQGRFFQMYASTLRNTVCWPAMGNHEGKTSKGLDGVGPYYDGYMTPTTGESGGLASGREAYYSFDFGRIHFIVLDSCDESITKRLKLTKLGDSMMEWLKADLEKAKADWLIAYWHHPPYTKGSHDSDSQKDFESIVMRETFMPILESAGVDLVLTGHSHIYERSMLMDGAYVTPTTAKNVIINDGDGDPGGDGAYHKSAGLNPHEGTVNIVTGNAGTSLKRLGTMPVMKKIILEHGSVLINVKDDVLHAMMLNKEGVVRDNFQIIKRGKVPVLAKIALPKPAPQMETIKSVKADGAPGEDSAPQIAARKLPKSFSDLIPKNVEWRYFLGEPPKDWTSATFDDSSWPRGKAGFGYGDGDDATKLDMANKYSRVFIRREFVLTGKEDLTKLGLGVAYDDGFIAYINGEEVARSANLSGDGPAAEVKRPHEANGAYEYFPLEDLKDVVKSGRNILCILGLNDEISSTDFSLIPTLIVEH